MIKALVGLINGNPYVRSAKNFRNRVIDDYFRSRWKDTGRDLADRLQRSDCHNVCFAIAFNTPWVIDILTASWEKYVTGLTLVVVDNSTDFRARKAIERLCRERGVAYLPLPKNPEWSPNRSHGIAMNWIFHNVVQHARPELFGYLDHDCFPIAPIDIPKRMDGKIVYGLQARTERPDKAWYLWAGLCFFRFSAVDGLNLDFKHRYEFGMDTGGGNWPLLYERVGPAETAAVETSYIDLHLGGAETKQQILDGCLLHLGGASYHVRFGETEYVRLLSDYVWTSYLGGVERRLLSV